MEESQTTITQENVTKSFTLIRSYLQLFAASKPDELPIIAVTELAGILLNHLAIIEEAYDANTAA